MASSKLPAPGTEFGPCAEDCAHIDCAAMRETAESVCRICGEKIGYERSYYRDGDKFQGSGRIPFIHASPCAWNEAEKRRTVSDGRPSTTTTMAENVEIRETGGEVAE